MDKNIKKINDELKKLNTTTEKLNYLYEIKSEIPEKYPVVSPLRIPKSIYDEHFKDASNNAEFTFWFLWYNATQYLKIEKEIKFLDENYKNRELKKIKDFESQAEKKFMNNLFEYYEPRSQFYYNDYKWEIEYFRIKEDYYREKPLFGVHAMWHPAVIMYARHVLLKEMDEGSPIISENKIRLIYEKFFEIWPQGGEQIEPLESFKKRFVTDIEPQGNFIPKGKQGGDKLTECRKHLFVMLHNLKEIQKEAPFTNNYGSFTHNNFGMNYRKSNYIYKDISDEIKEKFESIF